MKAFKDPADVRVSNADHNLAFTAAHEGGHALVILERKVPSITGGLPVRPVHAMEDVSAVVTFGALQPGRIFDVGAGQTLPGGREVFLDPHAG